MSPEPSFPTETLDRLDLVPSLGGHDVGQVRPRVTSARGVVECDMDPVKADLPVEWVPGGLEGCEEGYADRGKEGGRGVSVAPAKGLPNHWYLPALQERQLASLDRLKSRIPQCADQGM